MSRIVGIPLLAGFVAGILTVLIFVVADKWTFWSVVVSGITVAIASALVYLHGIPGSDTSPREKAEAFAEEERRTRDERERAP